MYKFVMAFVGVTMISVTLSSDYLRGDTLTVRKAWLSGGRKKSIERIYRYGSHELLSGKVSVDVGGGHIIHLNNGRIHAMESREKSTLNLDSDKCFVSVG